MLFRQCAFVLLCFGLLRCAVAQLDDEDFPPGLLASYSAGDRTIDRIDRTISFEWDAAPDTRLEPGPFNTQWSGQLLVKEPGTYRIHVFLRGGCAVSVDGTEIVSGQQDEPGWLKSRQVTFDFGERALRVDFHAQSLPAQIKLFWSSDHFGLEPIPGNLLFREEPNERLALADAGRVEFSELRCNRCHRQEHDVTAPPAGDLTKLRGAVSIDWLAKKIESPSHDNPHSRMPEFGFTAAESRSVAAALLGGSRPAETRGRPEFGEEDIDRGEELLLSTGCAACHQLTDDKPDSRLVGGSLMAVGAKRSFEWLYTWMASPERLNADHQMPVFSLSKRERQRVAAALASRGGPIEPPGNDFPKSLVASGQKLIKAAGCANCHRLKDGPQFRSASALTNRPLDGNSSCLAMSPDRSSLRPAFPNAHHEALRVWLESHVGPSSPMSTFARGQRVLEQKNCTACHERGHHAGITSVAGRMSRKLDALRGESEAMIPPSLNAAGDKLHDAALEDAVAGEQKVFRMPWLRIRMPRFRHSDEQSKALLSHLIASDRIPELPGSVQPKSSDEPLVDGYTLIGPRGLSCVACHKVGEYEPRVALGTRGSDLMMLGSRMRQSYFRRWTRSPIRIVPGMEMPSIKKPVPDLLEEDVERQLATIWDALNNPKFSPPTDPSSVEQLANVAPGAPARIIRDVFTNPEANGGGYVARSMAVGLNNGHTVVYDLDTFSLRQWAFGEMARQRTQGKSWFWDAAGLHVAYGFDSTSDFALRRVADGEIILPKVDEAQSGRLLQYRNRDNGAEFTVEVNFEIDAETVFVRVTEGIFPMTNTVANQKRSGWDRQMTIENLPDGFEFLVKHAQPVSNVGQPVIEWNAGSSEPERLRDESSGTEYISLKADRNTMKADGRVHYSVGLTRTNRPLTQLPELDPSHGRIVTAPGFRGDRLRLTPSIMPTGMAWKSDGTLVFTSLKGHVYAAHDTDGDGIEDSLEVIEEGLAAPFGILVDGDDLLVSHKPEVLRLRDRNGDGRIDERVVVATGWGYSDNYHDWTTGLIRDSNGDLFVGLGSDYSQPDRPKDRDRYRGSVVQIRSDGTVQPYSMSFRYPVGLAIDNKGRMFATDNQGVQNTFNEINHLVKGRHYGVPSRHEPNPDAKPWPPALQVPHPWARSINGLVFVRDGSTHKQLIDHAIACEYDSHYLARFTFQDVGDTIQGASYYFSKPNSGMGGDNFVGPICTAIAPNGDIYIGSIFDSGWEGGRNTGAITRLRRDGPLPNGIRELRATADGFEISFFHGLNPKVAGKASSYTIYGYTRKWQGGYATPDSERHRVNVESAKISSDMKRVRLKVDVLREGFVYEVGCGRIANTPDGGLWPATGHYTMTRIPAADQSSP